MISKNENQATLQPDGDIVASTVSTLRAMLREMAGSGVLQLTIDLKNVEMVDSTGLGLLISAHNSFQKLGGEISVVSASPAILELMTTMRMHQHFRVSGQ